MLIRLSLQLDQGARLLAQLLRLPPATLLYEQLDRLAEAVAGPIDIPPEQQGYGQVLMGFGVVGVALSRFAVGLECAGEIASPAADQPQVVPTQGDFWSCGGGAPAELFGLAVIPLLQQQGRQIEPRRQGQAWCQR